MVTGDLFILPHANPRPKVPPPILLLINHSCINIKYEYCRHELDILSENSSLHILNILTHSTCQPMKVQPRPPMRPAAIVVISASP